MSLPPLHLLRTFDAAGRLGSFKAAALALHVTPSSVSHQIAALESYFGAALFKRGARSTVLTAEGAQLLADVSTALARLRDACARVRAGTQQRRVRVSANPFLASEILIPLIEAFELAFVGSSIALSATELLEDPLAGEIDICIRMGVHQQSWQGLDAHPLFPVHVLPVISTKASIKTTAKIDFEHQAASAWALYAARQGLVSDAADAADARKFNSYSAAMRALDQGLGVALAMLPIVRPWIEQGRVRAWGQTEPVLLGSLYLLSKPLLPSQANLRAMRDWLIAEIRTAVGIKAI